MMKVPNSQDPIGSATTSWKQAEEASPIVSAHPASQGRRRGQGRTSFDCVALLLQGGGALGAYQAGVYEALAEANLHPDRVVGISIGAINAAIIAGNARENRVAKLREFWENLARSPFDLGRGFDVLLEIPGVRDFRNNMNSAAAAFLGVPGLYAPRIPNIWDALPGTLAATHIYDTRALKAMLEHLVDFDLINSIKNDVRLSLGSVNVRTGKLTYFDVAGDLIRPEHVMASGALPVAFPPIEVDGEHYWDGGIISNTPLAWLVHQGVPDTLAFQVDLWAAPGDLPRSLPETLTRMKEIANSNRTSYFTNLFSSIIRTNSTLARFLDGLPEELKRGADAAYLQSVARPRLHHIVNLIYRPEHGVESVSKEIEFSRTSMQYRLRAGYADTKEALEHPEALQRSPDSRSGIFVFDFDARG